MAKTFPENIIARVDEADEAEVGRRALELARTEERKRTDC
jgi:hypothetical protein